MDRGKNPLKAKIIWRIIFWLGMITLLFGIGLSAYRNQEFLVIGFAVIFLGIVFMGIGYLISLGKIKIKT
jgi:uncharacterized membrane protein